jgi:signal transduction histidine kinase
MISVILIDEKPDQRTELVRLLNSSGHFRVTIPPSREFVTEECRRGSTDAVIVLHDDPGLDGLARLTSLWTGNTDVPVIVASGTFNPLLAEQSRAHHARYILLAEPVESSFPALEQVTEMAVELHRAGRRIAVLTKRLEIVGNVTRHDVLNQLTAVNGYNELLLMMIEDPTMKSYLEKTLGAINRIRSQFHFAKEYQNLGTEPPRFQTIHSVVYRATESLNQKGVKVVDTCGNATVCADPLFDEAIAFVFGHAIRHGGNVTEIRVFLESDITGQMVLVCADNGTGATATDTEKIFEYGHDKAANGGLFFARDILAVTGITITSVNEPGKGARFEMHIPEARFQNEGGLPPA